jgi:hypothetical protein
MEKKKLIIKPRYGLCNQLLSISKGIIFGIISDRDIIFNGFQIDYRDENNLCEFNSIIDIDYLQQLMIDQNINIKISSNLESDSKSDSKSYSKSDSKSDSKSEFEKLL